MPRVAILIEGKERKGLTKGKEYPILYEQNDCIRIYDDYGLFNLYSKSHFTIQNQETSMQLINCPFCGGTAEILEFKISKKPTQYRASCEKCKSQTARLLTSEAATTAWNERVTNVTQCEVAKEEKVPEILWLEVMASEDSFKSGSEDIDINDIYICDNYEKANKEAENDALKADSHDGIDYWVFKLITVFAEKNCYHRFEKEPKINAYARSVFLIINSEDTETPLEDKINDSDNEYDWTEDEQDAYAKAQAFVDDKEGESYVFQALSMYRLPEPKVIRTNFV